MFTWNNPPADAYIQFQALREHISVINIGQEQGASGTPHLQGHLVLKSPRRLSQLVAWFPGCHFEPRRGSEIQAREYTEKEGNPDRLDWDDRKQGHRTDLAAMTAIVAANPLAAARNVAAEMPHLYVKFHSGVNALARALLKPTDLIVHREVNWHYGPTGTGKTHTALQEAQASAVSDDDIFVWSLPNLKFAGSYCGQSHVIIDELRTNWEHFSFSSLLSLLGNSRHEVEVKGGTVAWRALKIWVTAPVAPQHFCALVGDPIEQLLRRITTVRLFDVPYMQAPPVAPPAHVGTPPLYIPPHAVCPDSEDDNAPVVRAANRAGGVFAPLPMPVDSASDTEVDEDCVVMSQLSQ